MSKIILSKRENRKKQKFIRFLKENDTLAEFIIEFNKGNFIFESQVRHHKETDFSFDTFIHFYKDNSLGYIERAFDWTKTKKSQFFWFFLSGKERKIWNKI